MSAKLITKRRLAWAGLILILLLGFLLLPGVRTSIFHQAPANKADATVPGKNLSGIVPGSATERGTGTAEPALSQGAVDPLSRSVLFHVIDAKDSRGIAGAMLHAGEQPDPDSELPPNPCVTDAKGDCLVIVAPRTFVTVTATGYLNHTKSFPSSEYIPAEYLFKLEKGVSIGGTVRNEAGRPIRDVKVLVRPRYKEVLPAKIPILESLIPKVVRTDASGRWQAQNVPLDPDAIVSLELTHPEYVQSTYWTEQAHKSLNAGLDVNSVAMDALRRQDAVFTMKEGFLVTGTVFDEIGKSIQNVAIGQHLIGLTSRIIPKSTTGPDGRFSFVASNSEEIVVIAQAQGYAPIAQKIRIAPKMPEIQFRLAKGSVLTGRVVDENGKPVVAATISVVANSQYNREYLPWQGKSGVDGIFLWDSAPAFPMYFSITAQQYKNPNETMPYFLLEPGKENEVRLQRMAGIQLTGKVFDRRTNEPIDKFRVTTFSNVRISGQPDHTSRGGPIVEGANGEFTVHLIDRPLSVEKIEYLIRVEAPGYLPNTSQAVDLANGDQTLNFAMEHGDGIRGLVKLPNGDAAAGAKVSLFGMQGRTPTMLNTGALSYGTSFCETVTTDEEGKFSLNPMPEAHTIAVVHEKGLITAVPSQLGPSAVLVIQPWGRVQGRVKIGNTNAANQRVLIMPLITRPSPPGILVSLSQTTDSQGQFAIEKVPAGEYRVSSSNGSTIVVVRSGQTVSVTLGGTGRPLIGRFVLTDPEAQVPWSRLFASLSLILPDVSMPNPTDEIAYRAWTESEEGRQRLRSAVLYGVQIMTDGSFRIEDVVAGRYSLNVTVTGARNIPQFKREVVVPQIPSSRSDEPLDLGTISLLFPSKK